MFFFRGTNPIHCGIGLFYFPFLARILLTLNVFKADMIQLCKISIKTVALHLFIKYCTRHFIITIYKKENGQREWCFQCILSKRNSIRSNTYMVVLNAVNVLLVCFGYAYYAYEKPNVQSRNLETKHTFSNSLNFAGHSKLFTA